MYGDCNSIAEGLAMLPNTFQSLANQYDVSSGVNQIIQPKVTRVYIRFCLIGTTPVEIGFVGVGSGAKISILVAQGDIDEFYLEKHKAIPQLSFILSGLGADSRVSVLEEVFVGGP